MNIMNDDLSPGIGGLIALAADIGRNVVAPAATLVDIEARWPEQPIRALAEAGLLGLHVPARLGGFERGMLALTMISEELGRHCASTAMCFAMHCVASKVIAAKATADHEERYLRPIAAGSHLTTLALSEPATGAHFYLPQSTFRRDAGGFVLNGEKAFVTNGGHADSYVLSAVNAEAEMDPGTFSCLVVDAACPELRWLEPWNGFGMRGNSSRGLRLAGARLPAGNLIGREGDQIWFIFEIVAPYFLMAMAGVYLGVAQAALDIACDHLRGRRYGHTGESLAEVPTLPPEVARLWIAVERSRRLAYHAARQGDIGAPDARAAIFASKIDIAETAVAVTNGAMTLAGGRAFQQNSTLARLLRDARAAHVMSPTTLLLETWLGRDRLGLPLL
jgi:isovaleryl-CoA dehydrogenase